MDSENKAWVICTGMLVVFLITLVIASFYTNHTQTMNYINHGYEKVTINGTNELVWHKARAVAPDTLR